MNLHLDISGTYELKVLRADGTTRVHIPEFKNLIVDQGMDKIGANSAFMSSAFAGSGSTAPVVGNTTMQSLLGQTTTVSRDQAESTYSTPRYMVEKRVYSFAIGAVVGNVAEVGVGWNTGTPLVFSRALVVDGGGTPTTITVLVTEQLVLTYRLYVKIPDAPITFTYVDGATTYTINAQCQFVAANNGFTNFPSGIFGSAGYPGNAGIKETDVLPAINADFVGGPFNSPDYTPPAYVNGSFKQTFPAVFSAAGGVYPTGVGSAIFYTRDGFGRWAMNFSPKLPKIAGQTMQLTFELTWARGTPP